MPESPEVQALVDFLDEVVVGRTITAIDVLEFRVVKTRATLPSVLVGSTVDDIRRVGKHLDIVVDGRHLVVSLGRHGWARWTARGEPRVIDPQTAPTLVTIAFDDSSHLELTDAGSWVSLALSVVDHPDEVTGIAKLGRDPADESFTPADLDSVVRGRRKQLKAVLQEQESLAGIGNAYSDEILHRARLSPTAHAASLTDGERARLYTAIVETIRGAIAAQHGVPIDRLKAAKTAAMRVHGKGGTACPVCGDTVLDVRFGGTTAQFCPTCQRPDGLLL